MRREFIIHRGGSPGGGFYSLHIEGMPSMSQLVKPSDGHSLAHDVMEHFNGIERIGSLIDEYQAIGAALYTRGWNLHQPYVEDKPETHAHPKKPYNNMYASDLVAMHPFYKKLIAKKRLEHAPLSPFMDKWSEQTIYKTFRYIRISLVGNTLNPIKAWKNRKEYVEYHRFTLSHIRYGYNYMKETYKSQIAANTHFYKIVDAIHRNIPNGYNVAKGGKYKLILDTEDALDCLIEVLEEPVYPLPLQTYTTGSDTSYINFATTLTTSEMILGEF